jgi:uncharacterized protein YjbJ (UPF0337 family)
MVSFPLPLLSLGAADTPTGPDEFERGGKDRCCRGTGRSSRLRGTAVPVARSARATEGKKEDEMAVNSDTIQGNWQQLKGKVKEQWGKLTDDDLTYLEGKQDQLAGKIQERYGIARDEAEKQVREFRARNNW